MTELADLEQLRNVGGKIVIKRSLSNYSGNVVIAGIAVLWGGLSILYFAQRTLITKLLCSFLAQHHAAGANLDILLEIVFGMGLLINLALPLIWKDLAVPTKISVTQYEIEYKSRGTTQKMAWSEVEEITSTRGYSSRAARSGSMDFIMINGHEKHIKIKSAFDLPTDGMIKLLRQCWSVCTERNTCGAKLSTN